MSLVRYEKNKNRVANSHVAGFGQRITLEMHRYGILNVGFGRADFMKKPRKVGRDERRLRFPIRDVATMEKKYLYKLFL